MNSSLFRHPIATSIRQFERIADSGLNSPTKSWKKSPPNHQIYMGVSVERNQKIYKLPASE